MTIIPFPTSGQSSCGSGNTTVIERLLLPVAPRTNARIRFASTKQPPRPMMPHEAVAWLDRLHEEGSIVKSVDITGPGDSLAEPTPAFDTLALVKKKYPDIKLTLTTLGIGGKLLSDELHKYGVNQTTLLVDAVNRETAQKLYAWIRPAKKTIPLAQAVDILLAEQADAITSLKESGCTVNICTTIYPGYNDSHVEEIARRAASLGADSMTVVPFTTEADDDDAIPCEAGEDLMDRMRSLAAKHIAIVAAPPAHDSSADSGANVGSTATTILPKASAEKPNVAVVSSNGMEIDLHLGQAIKALIYGPREDGLPCLLGTRDLPEPGGGGNRWQKLADTLDDCFAILTAGAGDSPRKILGSRSISVLVVEDDVQGTVDVLYGGGKKGKKQRK